MAGETCEDTDAITFRIESIVEARKALFEDTIWERLWCVTFSSISCDSIEVAQKIAEEGAKKVVSETFNVPVETLKAGVLIGMSRGFIDVWTEQ